MGIWGIIEGTWGVVEELASFLKVEGLAIGLRLRV